MKDAISCRTKAGGKSRGKLASIGLAAIVLVGALSASTPTLAAPCNGVKFTFENNFEADVRVTRVRYRDSDDNSFNTRMEDVENVFCPAKSQCNTDGDNLGSITRPVRNHELFSFEVEYQPEDGNGWGPTDWTDAQQTDGSQTCVDGKTYGRFEIDD
jgi:hypothetical protein